jgi:hypothetical protein
MLETPKLLATTDMKIVAMTIFKNQLYLACEYGIYRLKEGTDIFEQLKLVYQND